MKTMTVAAEIASDGTLHLGLTTGLPPGPADVVVVVQPKATGSLPQARTLVGMFAPARAPEFDAVAEVRELRRRSTQEAIELRE